MSATDEQIKRAIKALAEGELVVFPTETLYGIGCDATNPDAVARLCAAKHRPDDKPLAVILGEAAQASQLTDALSGNAAALAEAFWPGPLTLVLPARPGLSDAIIGEGRVGMRVTSDPVAARLACQLGRPICAPSANPTGLPPAPGVTGARAYFAKTVSVYLDDGPRDGEASTVVLPGPPLEVLRSGPISKENLNKVISS
jgi:L-threonylcarbamoyladenylate synthase